MAKQHEQSANVGVSVLIWKGNQILLEKRQHTHGAGTWGPPGGHIDYGEAPEQTAARETMEETGIEISGATFRCVTNDVFEDEHRHYITLWFEADYVQGEARAKAPDEESEVGWFAWDALPQSLFLPLKHLVEGNIYASPLEN